MSARTVARRYAAAVFNVARERGQLEEWAVQLSGVLAALEENAELKRFFNHPVIPVGVKTAVVREVFGRRLQPEVLNFLLLLLEKRRERYLGEIHQEYNRLVQHALGIVEGTVRAASALAPDDLQSLEARLSAASGRDVRLRAEVDPSLIGGLLVRLGDRIYDGSLSGRLNRLRERLVAGE